MSSKTLPNQQSPQPQGVNPFAAALAEARGDRSHSASTTNGYFNESTDLDNYEEQERKSLEKQKRERLRQQLHRQINPVETTDIFNAKQETIKKQIDDIRYELKALSQEIASFNKDIEITLMSTVASPGTEGKYYFSFFQKLREFIRLLREKIHSARTWSSAFQSKQKKRKGMGMEISGKSHEQTATVFDRMHHERSTQYSGS